MPTATAVSAWLFDVTGQLNTTDYSDKITTVVPRPQEIAAYSLHLGLLLGKENLFTNRFRC